MDDETYIGLVDSHTERIGGNHHAALSFDPLFLFEAATQKSQTAVVKIGGDSVLL